MFLYVLPFYAYFILYFAICSIVFIVFILDLTSSLLVYLCTIVFGRYVRIILCRVHGLLELLKDKQQMYTYSNCMYSIHVYMYTVYMYSIHTLYTDKSILYGCTVPELSALFPIFFFNIILNNKYNFFHVAFSMVSVGIFSHTHIHTHARTQIDIRGLLIVYIRRQCCCLCSLCVLVCLCVHMYYKIW